MKAVYELGAMKEINKIRLEEYTSELEKYYPDIRQRIPENYNPDKLLDLLKHIREKSN